MVGGFSDKISATPATVVDRLTAFHLSSSRSSSLFFVELCLIDDRTGEASAAVEAGASYVHAHSLFNVSCLCDLVCQQTSHAGTKSKKGGNAVQSTIGIANILSGGVQSIAWAEGSVGRKEDCGIQNKTDTT